MRAQVPDRQGILAIDDTGLPKQGRQSVGVKRQSCGALGKTGNCQVAVSTLLIGATLVWPLTCELYLPHDWLTDPERRRVGGIPARLPFREKWRIGVAHVRQVVQAGFTLAAVVADADDGSVRGFRHSLERMGVRDAVGIRSTLKMWLAGARRSQTAIAIAQAIPARDWRRVRWGHGTKGPLAARFAARRVRPLRSRGERWLLCERSLKRDERKHYLLNLPETASLIALVRLARSRWPIEQQYRELKDELGFDHFEGRTYRGWNHHAVLTAMAFTFLQLERRRWPVAPRPTLPVARWWMREIAGLLYLLSNRNLLNLLDSFRRNPPLRR